MRRAHVRVGSGLGCHAGAGCFRSRVLVASACCLLGFVQRAAVWYPASKTGAAGSSRVYPAIVTIVRCMAWTRLYECADARSPGARGGCTGLN